MQNTRSILIAIVFITYLRQYILRWTIYIMCSSCKKTNSLAFVLCYVPNIPSVNGAILPGVFAYNRLFFYTIGTIIASREYDALPPLTCKTDKVHTNSLAVSAKMFLRSNEKTIMNENEWYSTEKITVKLRWIAYICRVFLLLVLSRLPAHELESNA